MPYYQPQGLPVALISIFLSFANLAVLSAYRGSISESEVVCTCLARFELGRQPRGTGKLLAGAMAGLRLRRFAPLKPEKIAR